MPLKFGTEGLLALGIMPYEIPIDAFVYCLSEIII